MSLRQPLYAGLLGACLLAPCVGTWGWLHYERVQVQREVKTSVRTGIDKAELHLFKFTSEQIRSLDWHHAGEFSINGERFDVVYRKQSGDTMLLWCWWDIREASLDRQSDQLAINLAQNATHENKSAQQLTDFLKTLICVEYLPLTTGQMAGERWWPEGMCDHALGANAPPTPPPDFV